MNAINDGGMVFACAWCGGESIVKQGRLWLCRRHYRFQQMRVGAKRHGKTVPTYLELENLFSWLKDMKCSHCERAMNWLGREGQATVISLQHDRETGKFRFLCRSCNTRHVFHPGDSFYSFPKDKRRCFMCKEIKPKSHFYIDRSRGPDGLKSSCKVCSDAMVLAFQQRKRIADAMILEREKSK